jgi:hypothetical protein
MPRWPNQRERVAAGSAESLQLGLCGFPRWHFSVGALIAEELFNVKSRGVAKAAPLRHLLLGFSHPVSRECAS